MTALDDFTAAVQAVRDAEAVLASARAKADAADAVCSVAVVSLKEALQARDLAIKSLSDSVVSP